VTTPPPRPALVPRYIYWEPTKKQWLISPQVGSKASAAELEGNGSTLECPADGLQSWKGTSSSSGVDSAQLLCAPTY